MKKKALVTGFMSLALLSSTISPCLSSVVFADEMDTSTTTNESQTSTSKLAFQKKELALQFKGIDLSEKNFDQSQMNDTEKEFLNKLLKLEYDQAKIEGTTNGLTKSEFISSLQKVLVEIYGNGSVDISNPLNSGANTLNESHGWVSTNFLGNAINVIIDAWLVTKGMPSLGAMAEILSEAAAKKLIEKELFPQIVSALTKLGFKEFSENMVTKVINALLTWFIDPGHRLAEVLDSWDLKPNNGWLEWW